MFDDVTAEFIKNGLYNQLNDLVKVESAQAKDLKHSRET